MRQIAERLVLDLVAVAIAAAKQMGDVLAALILPPRSDDVNCPTSLCHGANQCADLPTTSIYFSDYIMHRCNRALLPSAGAQPVRHDIELEGELQINHTSRLIQHWELWPAILTPMRCTIAAPVSVPTGGVRSTLMVVGGAGPSIARSVRTAPGGADVLHVSPLSTAWRVGGHGPNRGWLGFAKASKPETGPYHRQTAPCRAYREGLRRRSPQGNDDVR